MSSQQLDEEAIFHVARKLDDLMDREKYLNQICAGDQHLRGRVELLLDAHEKEAAFLTSSPDATRTAEYSSLTECPGTTNGRYRLMEQLGEGGMGTVFVAQQDRPIRRKVALKVIKPGMDSRAIVARFEAERQALAMMDHPNIAKVLDVYTAEPTRPVRRNVALKIIKPGMDTSDLTGHFYGAILNMQRCNRQGHVFKTPISISDWRGSPWQRAKQKRPNWTAES